MAYTLNDNEIKRIKNSIDECSAFTTIGDDGNGKETSEGNWVPLYTELSEIMGEHLEAGDVTGDDRQDIHDFKLWLDVAIGANGGVGIHSAMIRAVTNAHGRLRAGKEFTDDEMQLASNGVAMNVWKSLNGNKEGTPAWTVPSIEQVADADAQSIGENLYLGVLSDDYDTAITKNAGWAGKLALTYWVESHHFKQSDYIRLVIRIPLTLWMMSKIFCLQPIVTKRD